MQDYYRDNGLLGDDTVEVRAEAALRQLKGVHDDWTADEYTDGDNVEAGPSFVAQFLATLKGEGGETESAVLAGNFDDKRSGQSPRQVLGRMLSLVRGAVPGIALITVITNLGKMAMRPLTLVDGEVVSQGRVPKYLVVPFCCLVMPSSTGKSNIIRIVEEVLCLKWKRIPLHSVAITKEDIVC